ncbi:MAG TPA: hypothetical protein VJR93_04520 [Chthoniobacterales bacterium]|nr:hypothetical protein [Chthoniobacterales bacterium]
MFLLPRNQIPQNPEELAQAIEDGVRTFASRPQRMVVVRGGDASALDSIAVDLSGASIDQHHRPPPLDREGPSPAMLVRHIYIAGDPIELLGSEFSFQFEASNADVYQKPQPDGKLLLILHRAQDGNVRFEISRAAVETMIMSAASKLAEKQGVGVDNAQLELTQHGPRSVDGKLTVSAHKLIFHPVLTLGGTLAVSDDFVATVSNLKCLGQGPIASLACAAISPAFSRIEGRPFPLSALPLGEIQLRDIALDASHDKLVIRACFGSC